MRERGAVGQAYGHVAPVLAIKVAIGVLPLREARHFQRDGGRVVHIAVGYEEVVDARELYRPLLYHERHLRQQRGRTKPMRAVPSPRT